MSKTITSNIEGFKGSVILKQPLHLDEVFAIENALDKSANAEPSAFWKKINETLDKRDEKGNIQEITWSSVTDSFFLEAIIKCAEKFIIDGLPESPAIADFPMTPRARATEFIQMLWSELQKIYNGETIVPNES